MFGIPVLTFKLLVVSYITAKRQLIHDRTASRNTWNQSYDFIVVGAGAAGCIVANRLTENPNVNVLLLDAGRAQDTLLNDLPGRWNYIGRENPSLNWAYYNQPERNAGQMNPGGWLMITGGRTIGGSSSHNGMVYHRGNRRTYDNWVKTYGAEGWSYKEVLPYFLRYENNTDLNVVINNPGYHSTTGPIQVSTPRNVDRILLMIRQTLNDLGYNNTDVNGANQAGVMITQELIDQRGFRSESANAYVDPNPHPNNLHIVANAMVLRILFNGTTAIGVEFDRNDTSYRVYARREVIVSAGNFQTPQLLMLSGIGPRDNLQSFGVPVLIDLPVGNNYQCIPVLDFASTINQSLINPPPELTIDNLIQLYFNSSGPLSHWPSILLFHSTIHNDNIEWPNAEFTTFILNSMLVLEVSLIRFFSRGTAVLQSDSPYIPLKFYSNLLSDSRDFNNMLDAMKIILYIMERTQIAQYVQSPRTIIENVGCPSCNGHYMYECNEALSCYIRMMAQIEVTGGTCRMGAVNRNDVVVDPNLRVKNTANLRVCDASILPELPNSGTITVTLMVGEKCAQIIKNCYNLN